MDRVSTRVSTRPKVMLNTLFIIYLEYAKDFQLVFFNACFLLVKLTRKIYRVTRKISYNRNPVKESEVIYSKFHQIINITTYQILCMGGSSIP
jgi:hypothetical protein